VKDAVLRGSQADSHEIHSEPSSLDGMRNMLKRTDLIPGEESSSPAAMGLSSPLHHLFRFGGALMLGETAMRSHSWTDKK
jgi:hypothetical protein